jgi:N-methylhydantoinase B
MGMIMAGMAGTGDGAGLAEPCYGSPPMQGVTSGRDARRNGAEYIFQAFSGSAGGPAAPDVDGWLTYLLAAAGGIVYVDSTEVVEQKYPVVVWEKVVRMDSEGAGRTRGAPGGVSIYGPRLDPMTCHYFLDGVVNRPVGVRGGGSPLAPEAWKGAVDGSWTNHPEGVGEMRLETGECVVSLSGGGGGYAPPTDRDPAAVLGDVADGYVSVTRAREVYGVVLAGDPDRWETLGVDVVSTHARRAGLAETDARMLPALDDAARAPQAQLDWWVAA